MLNLILSILAAVQTNTAPLPVVKTVGFGGTPRVGGQEAAGWVELSAPAPCVRGCGTFVNGKPSGGMMVNLSSSNSAVAKVQPSTGMIMVPVGQTLTTFTVLTFGVSAPTAVTISAWRDGSAPQTTILNVVPPSLTNFTIDQPTVISGGSAHGTVTFNGVPGPGGVKATLTSNSAAVQVPASASLDVNKTAATFDIKTSGVAASTPVTMTAVYGDRKPTAALTVTPAVLTTFNYNNTNISTQLYVQLNGAAPPSGAVITLSSADPAHVSVPPTVTVPAGSNRVAFPVTEHPDFSKHNVTMSATYNGVTKKHDYLVLPNFKPDLAIKEVTLKDRFGNAITHPADAQPYKMCVTIELLRMDRFGNCLCPTSTALNVSYLSPTGTGTSVGHEFDLPVTFTYDGSPAGNTLAFRDNGLTAYWYDPVCVDMPGLPQPGAYTDVTLIVDPNNKNDESNPGNNTHKLRITRQ
jgi:hypothetical protein